MSLTTNGRIDTDTVEQICRLRNDVYRNRWITFAYWSISQRLKKLIGDNASWCTFSTWSSRTIGENLRFDKASRRIQELINDPDTAVFETDNRLLLELQYRVATRDDGAAQRTLALGNHLVFHEIGYAVVHFLDWTDQHPDFDEDAWEGYRAAIEPYEASDLFPAADVEQLRSGLECYYRAKYAGDGDTKAELVLQGNLLLGAYEQWRLDPMLKVALDPLPGRLVRVVRANPHAQPELSLPGAGTPWALRHHSPILRAFSAQFGAAMTRWVMAFDVPLFSCLIRPLRVGHGIPPLPDFSLYPSALEALSDPGVARLFAVYDRSDANPARCAARNWTVYPDRMTFIVNLFRAGQQDGNLYRDLPDADLRILELDMSDDKLKELRQVGDDEAQRKIENYLNKQPRDRREAVQRLVQGLDPIGEVDPSEPPLPAWAKSKKLRDGQKFFRTYGAEIGSALFSASLPLSYTAARGARVLTTTAALVSDTKRRIAETGMMLLAAMASDDSELPPLRPDTAAYQAARKLRLFHGAVRHMILTRPELHWNKDELGVPVNQEDLLGTLAVFTVAVIASLDKMGVTCKVEDRDAYFHLWLVIGHLLGIDYDRLYREPPPDRRQPLTYAEMQLLARIMFDRNAEASAEGQELASALLKTAEEPMPFFAKALPRALIRRLIGEEPADMLGVPPPGVMRLVVAALRPFNAMISPLVHSNALAGLANTFTRKLYRTWIDAADGSRPPWLNPLPIRVRDAVVGRSRDLITQTQSLISGSAGVG